MQQVERPKGELVEKCLSSRLEVVPAIRQVVVMQDGLLEASPELLNGIGPGRVGRQPADLDAQSGCGGEDDRMAMHRPVVPD